MMIRNELIECEICGKTFPAGRSMEMHKLRVHTKGWSTNRKNLTKERQLAKLTDAATGVVIDESRVVVALLDRNDELQAQISKLISVIETLEADKEALTKRLATMQRPTKTHMSEALTHRVQDALPPGVWNSLRNGT